MTPLIKIKFIDSGAPLRGAPVRDDGFGGTRVFAWFPENLGDGLVAGTRSLTSTANGARGSVSENGIVRGYPERRPPTTTY